MNMENYKAVIDQAAKLAMDVGLKLVGALVLWIVGRWLIRFATKLAERSMRARKIDETLVRYVGSSLGVLLNVLLLIAILSVFGVETTTFAGLLAAGGVAIGVAWSGMLSNFAAGVFMIVLRPIKAGDYVIAGGVEGTVREIGLFVTSIDTPDNVCTFVGNAKIFGDNIKNYSTNPYRRVELKAQLNHGVDHDEAMEALREAIVKIDNVLDDPGPDFEILDFNLAGPVLAVRPYCHTDHYWQVYFDTNRAIRESFSSKGFPTPREHLFVTTEKDAA